MDLKIIDKYNFSDAEKKFMEDSRQQVTTSDINQSRIISDFILGKKIEGIAEKMITSNEKLATSNEKYSKRMLILTGGLVFVGVVQVIVQLIQILKIIKTTP